MADLNSQLFQQLAQMMQAGPSRKTGDMDIAKYILGQSAVDFSHSWDKSNMGPAIPKSPGGKGGPSNFSRLIDLISRPLYGVADMAKETGGKSIGGVGVLADLFLDPSKVPGDASNALHGLSMGLQGKHKTTWSSLIRDNPDIPLGYRQGPTGFATGLTADILGDPTSFIGGGPIKALVKGVKGLKAGKASEEAITAAGKVPEEFVPKVVAQSGPIDRTPSPLQALSSKAPIKASVLAGRQASPTAGKSPIAIQMMKFYAAKAVEDAPKVSMALDHTTKTAAAAENALSPMQAAQVTRSTMKDAQTILKGTEASQGAQKAYKNLVYDVMKQHEGPVLSAVRSHSRVIEAQVLPRGSRVNGKFVKTKAPTYAKNWPKAQTAITHALNTVLDEPIRTLKPGETVSEKGVVYGIMSRVATFWGHKDLRPAALDAQTSAIASAERAIKAWEYTFKGHTDAEIMQAFEVAAERKPPALALPGEVALADSIKGGMEQWFKSSTIAPVNATANSAALRSGMSMEALNKMLERYQVPFKFSAEGKYANGTDWLNSWERHEFKTPVELKRFLFATQKAAEQLTREYGFVDDLAARFGSTVRKAGDIGIDHPRLKGFFFNKQIADQISLTIDRMHDFYTPKSKLARFVASGTSMWKSSVTKYHPRHHIANIIGDSYLMWLSGVNDPRVFGKAAQVLYSQAGKYKDLKSVQDLIGNNAVERAMAKPGTTIVKNKSGVAFTADQIYIAMHNHGLLQSASAIEDIMRPGLDFLPGRMSKPFGGHVSEAFSKVSENREHYVKIAHMVDLLGKSKGKDIKEIFSSASHEVRKWHPDGMDLTSLEQKIRLPIPFYSWLRKSTPLLVEGAVMNPQKAFGVPAKAQYNAQQQLGIPGTSLSQPFPSDQLFPSWIQEKGIGPLGKTGLPGLAGMIGGLGRQGIDSETGQPIGGYTVAGPSNPLQDLFGQFGGFSGKGVKQGLLSALNPMARVPLETLITGNKSFSGAPITDKSDYINDQIPISSNIARMTNISPFGPTSRGNKEGTGIQGEGTTNWFTNAGIVGTGPYIKQAQFEAIPGTTKENKKIREFANSIGFPMKDKGKIPQWIRDLYNQRQGG